MTEKEMQTYEVAFVVYGYIDNEDENIGLIECNGLQKYEHQYWLKDGRMYYSIDTSSPQKAYELKALTVTDWCLEHVSIGDRYWYKEDLKL